MPKFKKIYFLLIVPVLSLAFVLQFAKATTSTSTEAVSTTTEATTSTNSSCSLGCSEYTYSTCPEGCEKSCVSSGCSEDGLSCTDDCDGAGSCSCPATTASVRYLNLSGEGEKIEWEVEGYSEKGFKVVWSKNSNPTYPLRDGDKYHYYSDPSTTSDTLNDFDGAGTYYVRVCEYLGGECDAYSNEIKVILGSVADKEALEDETTTEQENEEAVATDDSAEDAEYPNEIDCIAVYKPVCGVNGKQYSNRCEAEEQDKVKVAYEGVCKNPVSLISLSGTGANIMWEIDGHSKKGFKVVWSKNPRPTYPTRYGDKYHYYSNSNQSADTLSAFNGAGIYYVRVCEYLGGKCGVYSNEIKVELASKMEVEQKYNKGKKTVICADEYEPVCGVNGKTYPSKCYAAEKHGVKIAYHGVCAEKDRKEKYKKMYKYAKWICDGEEDENVMESSCKTQQDWKEYAGNFCKSECAGEKCEVVSLEVEKECVADKDVIKIKNKVQYMQNNQFGEILAELKELRSIVKEQQSEIRYLKHLKKDIKNLSAKVEETINNFITYGVDDNTKKLGAGERAAVMHSYKAAFNKLPETEDELADAVKIANGRWPTMRKIEAENMAKEKFKKIYKRIPNMNNQKDNAAVTIMAYGLRQRAENRNLESEKKGIAIFKGIFKKLPETTDEWNTMQAITYSGSARETDTDGDLLCDRREKELGTDANNPDTDGDGFMDGVEVANGYDPLS